MTYSKNLSSSCLAVALLATSACSTMKNFPHHEIAPNEKIGVYAYLLDPTTGATFASTLLDSSLLVEDQSTPAKLQMLSIHKLVLKEVMQSFPSRTNANVSPILSHQAKFAGQSVEKFDSIATGKSLSLGYVLTLKVIAQLITTGYVYQEQWRPEIKVMAEMIRIKDGQQVMTDSIVLQEKAFLKFLSPKEQNEVLQRSYKKLAANAAQTFSNKIGPVRRTIPKKEKMIHEKIYAFGRIRAMANKNNCVISGDLRKVTTDTSVLYHVPCRDIVLTYACDSDSDKSRCWLQ